MEYIDFLNIQQIYYWIFLLIKNLIYYLNPVRLFTLYYEAWPVLMFYSFIISCILLFCILYIYNKRKEVLVENSRVFETVLAKTEFNDVDIKNERWDKILQLINSEQESDWKMAIIDADVILDEMLTKSGYHGESLGEKLRSVEVSDFTTLNSAWEAHKIRNMIAHGGPNTVLNKRLAKKAISMYKEVFQEFEFI